jgi:cytochrome P450
MPKRDAHLQFRKWADEYGPIYSLILGTKPFIVLSSAQAVKDLLDKKSALYSDRQEMYVGQTLGSGGLRLLMMVCHSSLCIKGTETNIYFSCRVMAQLGDQSVRQYISTFVQTTNTMIKFRKLVHSLLNVTAAKSYVPYQDLENKQMLYEMIIQPDQFLQSIRRYSNALTTTMVFGWRSPIYHDPKLMQLFDGFSEFADLNQTGIAALLESFPLLRKLPDFLVPVQRKAKELHQKEKDLYVSHWLKAKQDIANGTIKPCFCVGLAEAQEKGNFDDAQAAYISGTLLEAGSDTTSSTLYAFVQVMLLYPEIQRKAQDELDKVVGSERMPTMDDEQSLQYIRACMKETLRWMPTTILGAVPHAVTQDDTYNGYLIPKGAGVLNNVWGIHMDPERFPNPRQFDPERYRDDLQSLGDAAANPDASKRDQFTFGAGRRICPGIHVAERSLFLGMSRMLWAFNIEPALDKEGNPILPDPDKLTQGFVCMPEEFPAKITPRSKEREAMVIDSWKKAERESLDPETKQWR